MDWTTLVGDYGFPIAVAVCAIALVFSLVRTLVKYFLKSMDDEREERQNMSKQFTTTIQNHLHTAGEKDVLLAQSVERLATQTANGFNEMQTNHKELYKEVLKTRLGIQKKRKKRSKA